MSTTKVRRYESTKVLSYFRTKVPSKVLSYEVRRYFRTCLLLLPYFTNTKVLYTYLYVYVYSYLFSEILSYESTSVLRSPLPYTCTTLEEKTCTYRVFRSFKTGDGPLSFIDSASLPSCAYVLHPHATTHAVEEDLKSHKNGLSTARAFMTSRSKFSHLLII